MTVASRNVHHQSRCAVLGSALFFAWKDPAARDGFTHQALDQLSIQGCSAHLVLPSGVAAGFPGRSAALISCTPACSIISCCEGVMPVSTTSVSMVDRSHKKAKACRPIFV